MFEYYISGTVKQGTSHYLVTITDTTQPPWSLLGNVQYIVTAKNSSDAQAKAMTKHQENKDKKIVVNNS